jgi:Acetyltransferase (GNAT) domain
MHAEERVMQVEFVGRADEIDASVWRDCFRVPLEGCFWYQTLETSGLEGQFTFSYGLIKLSGKPVGIAPCFLHDVPIALVAPRPVALVLALLSKAFPRVGYQRTFFVGSPCSDEGTIGLIPGVKLTDVMDWLADAVRKRARELKAPMIVFKDFRQADLPALTGLAGFFPTVSYPGTVVTLPAEGKEAYYRSLAHTQRHNLLKKLRRSRELLPLKTTVVKRPSDRELAEIFGLFMQTYERGKTKFERLDLRFFERVREQEPARFILQRDPASGALVAFMLVFHLGDRVINKFIGLDYRVGARAYLYFRLFDAAVDFACACGAKELQSGQTGYRAKLDLGHRLVPLLNVFCHGNPVVHALFRAIGGRVTWRSLDDDLATYLCAHPGEDRGAPPS